MDEESGYGHVSYQLFKLENPTYILPDLRMVEDLLDVKDPLYQAGHLENPTGILSDQSIKQEYMTVEEILSERINLEFPSESPSDIPPIIPVKEESLDIKEEPGILDHMVVYGDDSDECDTGNKIMKLRDGSDEDLVSLSKEETVNNNTIVHNRALPESAMQLSLNVIPSSSSDCKIPSVLRYSKDTVKKGMCKKIKSSIVQRTDIQFGFHEPIDKNKPILQYESLNTSEETFRCNENKRNICDTCHKCFSTSYNLKTHIKIHTSSKPYTCETCNKCLNQLSHIKTHNRIHTGSKPYICDACHKGFSDVSNLKRHISLHMVNKPYTCNTCHKCFNQLSNLKRHNRIHSGSKPYTCDTCYKCFSQLAQLKKHINLHVRS